MTVTILSLVCIVPAALCLCLWVYASRANEDLIEAQWEYDYIDKLYCKLNEAYAERLDDIESLRREVIELQVRYEP